jgi:hypothetical protein
LALGREMSWLGLESGGFVSDERLDKRDQSVESMGGCRLQPSSRWSSCGVGKSSPCAVLPATTRANSCVGEAGGESFFYARRAGVVTSTFAYWTHLSFRSLSFWAAAATAAGCVCICGGGCCCCCCCCWRGCWGEPVSLRVCARAAEGLLATVTFEGRAAWFAVWLGCLFRLKKDMRARSEMAGEFSG